MAQKMMTLGTVALIAALIIGAGTARAGCLDKKLKLIAKKEAGLLKCQAKDAAKPDPTKLSGCESKVMGKFGRVCSKAGTCAGECAACESNADSCGTNVRAAFGSNGTLLNLVAGRAAAAGVPFWRTMARSPFPTTAGPIALT